MKEIEQHCIPRLEQTTRNVLCAARPLKDQRRPGAGTQLRLCNVSDSVAAGMPALPSVHVEAPMPIGTTPQIPNVGEVRSSKNKKIG